MMRSLLVILALLAALLGQPAESAAAPSFTAYGDVNDSSRGDAPAPVFGHVLAGMRATRTGAAVSTGDFLNDIADTSVSTATSRWDKVLAVERDRLGLPVWRTAGDNDRVDVSARLEAWNRQFSGYPTTPDDRRRWYSKQIDGIHVVLLNAAYGGHMGWVGYEGPGDPDNSAQADWLVKDLRAASARPATIVVVMHYPLLKGKTDKPYARSKAAEAARLRALFARSGVDLVLAGDTHVYRKTIVTVTKNGRRYKVPYVQIPPAASPPRRFGVEPIPALTASEAGWAPGSSYRGFVAVKKRLSPRTLTLSVFKVSVSNGAVSFAADRAANRNPLGGTYRDVPAGSRL
jgi:hypothetical protein